MSNFLQFLAGGMQGALQKKQRNDAIEWERKVYGEAKAEREAARLLEESRYQQGLALRQQEQAESRRMQGVALASRELQQTTDPGQARALVRYINTNGQGIVPPKDEEREAAAATSRGYVGVVQSLPAFREVGLNAEQVRTALPAANQFIPRAAPPVSQPMVSPQPVQPPVPATPDPYTPLWQQMNPAPVQQVMPGPYQPPVDPLDTLLGPTEEQKQDRVLKVFQEARMLSQYGAPYPAFVALSQASGVPVEQLYNQTQVDKIESTTERNLASAAHQNALAKAVPETTRIKLATLANAVRNTSSMIQNREVMATIAQQRVAVSRELASIARAGLDLKGNQLAADEIDRLLDLAESLYRDATDQSQIAAGAYEYGLSGTAREAKEKAATQKLRADTIMSNLGVGTTTVPAGTKAKPSPRPTATPKGKAVTGDEAAAQAKLQQLLSALKGKPGYQQVLRKINAERDRNTPYSTILSIIASNAK